MSRGLRIGVFVIALIFAASTTASCSSSSTLTAGDFAKAVEGTGEVRLTGWATVRGEVRLFVSSEAMRANQRYPYCISGVFSDQPTRRLQAFARRKVTVTGRLFDFESLADEDRPVAPRKVIGGVIVSNWCFGRRVLLLEDIQAAR